MPGHYGGSHSTSSSRDTGSDYGQFDRAVSRAANNSTPSAPSGSGANNNNYQDRIIQIATTPETVPGFRGEGGTDERGNVGAFDQRSGLLKSFDQAKDALTNYIQGGGIIGAGLGIFGNIADQFNKSRRTNWLEGTDKFGMPRSRDFYIAHGKAFDPNAVLDKGSDEYSFLEDSGYFKQFNNPENFNKDDPSSAFDDPTDFSYDTLTNNPNPYSMVNQYFSSLGNNNLGISSNYTNTYNQAKANLAKSLNMTPNTQQYGYTANPYSQYPSTMTSANPFFDELTEQGLI
jgi:hypothetical protein